MTRTERSERVKAAAAAIGFDLCGIAEAGPVKHGDFLDEWLAKGNAGTMTYLHRHQASRIDVRAWLPWAKSVIVVALNYRQTEPHDHDPAQSTICNPQSVIKPHGRVAMYAWGEDYHVVVREKLDALVARMREILDEPFEARVCVDMSAIIEREMAAASGIGWIGKNTLILHASLGSFFFLGEIITDLALAPDTPEPDHCGTCTCCLDACPSGALTEPHVMDARRCIAYLTIEHRGDIHPDLAAKMDNWVFGCDICQSVCPFNTRGPETAEPRFWDSKDAATLPLDDILSWDEAAYRVQVKGKATARAKLHSWKRNAEIALRHVTRSKPRP